MRGDEGVLHIVWSTPVVAQSLSGTHHERLKVGSPPLCQAVTDLPVVVHTVRRVELARIRRWRESLVQATLQTFDLVFAGFQVVSGPKARQTS